MQAATKQVCDGEAAAGLHCLWKGPRTLFGWELVTASHTLLAFRLGVGVQRLLWILVVLLGLERRAHSTQRHRASLPIEPPPLRTSSWAARSWVVPEVKV